MKTKRRSFRPEFISGFGVKLAKAKDYEHIREQLRQKYHIWEGCKARILHKDFSGRHTDEDAYSVTIVAINEHHVTVEFPKGFRQSLSWKDFEKELMVLL